MVKNSHIALKMVNTNNLFFVRENLSSGCANNKDADQSALLGSLISAFVIHLLECIISKLATSEISIF